MSTVLYRKAALADCRALAELKCIVWNTTYKGIYADETLAYYDVQKNQRIFEDIVANPDIELYIAECDGKPIGLMSCGKPFRPFMHFQQEVGLLYILKEYQRRGIGKGFIQIAQEQACLHGYDEFLVSVNRQNRPAIDFYLAMGGQLVLEDERQLKFRFVCSAESSCERRPAMKKALLLLLTLLMLLSSAFTACAEEAQPSAGERIMFYHQDTSEAALEAYPYNAIYCKSASFSVLGGNGCSLYAGLHAYQWLFGKFESLEEQTIRAQEMVDLLEGKSPAVKGNGPSVSFRYARKMGAYKEENLQKTRTSISRFFDEKEGVLYLHATWPGGGHYFVAVGYTWHEINGENTFLLHVVDSGAAGTVKQFRAYDFTTFERAVPQAYELPAQEYWMPLQSGVDIFYGMWTQKKEAED